MSRQIARGAIVSILGGAALLAAVACASSPGGSSPGTVSPAGAPADDAGGFVVTLGRDTTVVERFTRTATRLEGALLRRAPTTTITRYSVELDAAGRPTRMAFRTRRPDGSIPPGGAQSVTLTFAGDEIVREIHRDTVIRTTGTVAGGSPYINDSFALYELALRRARAVGADSSALAFLPVAAQRFALTPWPARFLSPTAARVYYFGDPQQVTLDAQGRILAIDATGTTNKVRVARVPAIDIDGLGASFAAREAAGNALAQTTRDTVRTDVAGAELWIDYGRPVARGRVIFGAGGIVPDDVVWRTGANAATQIRTSRDLDFGGTVVPAGFYSLYTLPAAGGRWQLIVNRATGQWGTVYDQAQDLARIPLRVESPSEPVERFTIAVEPQGNGGALTLTWSTTKLVAPFTVR